MKNFFKGISWTQISAGALAAVTSFLLSAKIGVAGSVIGVAVGSIVSAVASQIYQNVLKESGKKLQAATPFSGDAADEDGASHVGSDAGETQVIGADGSGQVSDSTKTDAAARYLGDGDAGLSSLVRSGSDSSDQTQVLGGQVDRDGDSGQARMQTMTSVGSGRSLSSHGGVHADQPGTGVLGASQQQETQKRRKRIAIVVSVVSALAAVALTAGIITLVTNGKGTDDVARNIVTNSTTHKQTQDDSDAPQQSDSDSGKSNGSLNGSDGSTANENQGDGADSSRQTGKEPKSSGQQNSGTSGNDGSSTSGNQNGSGVSGSTGSTGSGSGNSGTDSGNTSEGTGSGSGGSSSDSDSETGSAGSGSTGSSSDGSSGTGGSSTPDSGAAGGQTGTSSSQSRQ